MHVLGPRAARLLDERAEHPLIAGQRARVRGRGSRPGLRRADLQDRHADVALRSAGEGARKAGAVAVGLEEQRDGADVVVLDERVQERAGVEHRLVADGRDRVPAQSAPERQRVHGDVPALRDQRDPAGGARHEDVAPQRGTGVERDEPVAVRPDDRERKLRRRVAQLGLQRVRARLGEPRREHDERAAAAPPGRAHDFGHTRGGDRDDHRVGRLGQVVERRHARPSVHLAPRGVDAPDRPLEAERGEVAQRRISV